MGEAPRAQDAIDRAAAEAGRIRGAATGRETTPAELRRLLLVALDTGRPLGACLAALESRLSTWPEELRG